jgi:hydroxypyruvate reductase
LIDNFAVNQAKNSQLNLEKYLRNNNSNSLFKKLGTELITGPTGCNVNDIVIILLED